MSTLTDFFTSLANKVRSKLGTEITYTPAEAVSAIDDVYDAGEAAGIAETKVGTAQPENVLSGTTFTNATRVGANGSMTNNGAVSQSLNCGGSYTVPAGYHNGSGKVTANSLASQTGVDSGKTAVTAGTMVSGYQGWVNGSKITGTFAGQEKTVTAGTSATSVTPDSGKYLTKVTYNPTPSQSKSASPSTSAQTISPDSGKLLSSVSISAISPQRAAGVAATTSGLLNATNLTGYVYFPYGWHPNTNSTYGNYCSVTQAQAQACHYHTATATVSTRGSAVDIGQTHSYRYVNTNGVPNSNSSTYTPSGDNRNKTSLDMGATNSYRYVNTNVCYTYGAFSAVTGCSLSVLYWNWANQNSSKTYSFAHTHTGDFGGRLVIFFFAFDGLSGGMNKSYSLKIGGVSKTLGVNADQNYMLSYYGDFAITSNNQVINFSLTVSPKGSNYVNSTCLALLMH